jgi:hypothetical protein
MTIDALETAASNAHYEHYRLCRERDDKITRLVSEYRLKVSAEVSEEYKDRVEQLAEAERVAKAAEVAAKDAAAKQGVDARCPIGTILTRWKWNRWANAHRGSYEKTNERGAYDVITSESNHPANIRWGRARIGQYVVRPLKKDGTPGIAYKTNLDLWFPEGINPNNKDTA